MIARAWLPPSALQSLETGQPVTVLVDNTPFAATLVSLGTRADTTGQDAPYLLEAEFQPEPDSLFRAGQAARIRLP
jgi:hypothetical protein